MKRTLRLSLVLLVLSILTAALILVATAQAELPTTCSHCDKDVTWLPLSGVTETTIPAGHYYVDAETLTVTNKTVAKSTAVCIYMNGNTVDAGCVDRVFYVNGTLSVMGQGTVKGYGRDKSISSTTERHGGTVYISSGGIFNLYDATVTSEKLTDSKASNGGNINVYGTFNMYSGSVCDGYASNAGGNIFVNPSGIFNMYGGSITGGSCGTGKSVCAKGKVRLAGNATINHLYLWQDTLTWEQILTVEGPYTGNAYIQLRNVDPAVDMVVGTSDNANLRLATLNFEDTGLYTKVNGSQLILVQEDPTIKKAYCNYCKDEVFWSMLTEADAEQTTLAAGHYYLDFLEGSDEWASKAISGTVCLDLNGQTLNGTTRAFEVQKNGVLNIQGNGTVNGRGLSTTLSSRAGGTVLVSSGGTLNLYSGKLSTQKVTGQAASNGGVVCVYGSCNIYGGEVSGGYASNAGSNIFVTPAGNLHLFGGTIGTALNGRPLYCQGNLLLAGNASVSEAYLTYKSGGPAIDSMLTVQGVYSGNISLILNGMTFEKGTTVGISKDADLSHAGIAIENCDLFVMAQDGALKLTDTIPVITKNAPCPVCGKNATWTALMENYAGQSTIEGGHYYLDFARGSALWDSKTISGMVCLDLNGQTLTGTTRAFTVESGSILNLLGDGTVIGRGRASSMDLTDRVGGAVLVEGQAIFNQYGGKLTFEKVDGQSAGNGGVVNVEGTYNLYNGCVENGQSTWVGGNIFVTIQGSLNLYGGTVSGGSATKFGQSITCRGKVKLSGNASVNDLYLYPNTAEGGPALSEMVTVQGKYTGSVKLRVSGLTAGMDIGTSIEADLSEATVTTTSSSISGLAVHGKDLILLGDNGAAILNGSTVVNTYADLASAITAYDNSAHRIVLFADVSEDIVLTKDVCVDLNGFHITGTVSGEGMMYCMDAQTDDFSIEDNIYGTVAASANVAALSQDSPCSEYSYLMVEEDGKLSFHCVKLKITGLSLRPRVAGLYYTCSFAGDEVVKQHVTSFGVLVSVNGDPLTVGETGVVGKTVIDKALFGVNTASNSSLIQNIMKTDINTDDNEFRANMLIYGRTYVQLGDITVYGECVSRSLKQQLCGGETMFGIERIWDSLSVQQRRSVMDMYSSYEAVMSGWTLPRISGAVQVRDDAGEDILLERRAQVVAKMRLMSDIYWRATEDVKYRISSTARWVEFKAGRVYRGIPYAYARSDQNTFLEFAGEPDENGIYPISGLTTTHLGNGATFARIGNDCSGSVNFAWSSVGADISGTQSSRFMIEKNGYYKVGDYEYTPTEDGRVGISKDIVAANGKEIMFEAYAKVQPGDGLDSTAAGGGHVILVVDKHVVYNADGSINGDLSYIHTLEQTPGPVSITVQQHSYNEELGQIVYDIYVEKNMTFNQVYSSGYLPITVKVLTDPTPVAAPSVTDSLSPAEYSYENLLKGELTCSRMISSVTITVTDENGQVFSCTGSGIRASIRKYYMQNFLTEDPAVMRGSLDLEKLVAGNQYHCTVVVKLASGDAITVRDFDFTATDADISVPDSVEPPVETEPEEEEIPE